MKQFTDIQYLAISLANQAGKDKLTWDKRIEWTITNESNLENLVPTGNKEKFLYLKALKAFRDIQNNKPVKYIMDLDASNSGVQLMAALLKCRVSANNSNVIGQDRNDLYGRVKDSITGVSLTRTQVKEACIPALYGSILEPMKLLGDGEEFQQFFKGLYTAVPALKFLTELFKGLWNPEALSHEWTLPDGHKAFCPTLVGKKAQLTIGGAKFNYLWEDNCPDSNSTPLMVNIIHSFDGYIAREMVRRANDQGWQLAHIHDSFWTQLGNLNQMRMNYRDILMDITKEDYLNAVCKEINPSFSGLVFDEEELNLWKEVKDTEYPLS